MDAFAFIDATIDAGLVPHSPSESMVQVEWVSWPCVEDGEGSPWPCGCGWTGPSTLVPESCTACNATPNADVFIPVAEVVELWVAFDPTQESTG